MKDIMETHKDFLIPTYSRLPITLVKGKGAKVWDSKGKQYLDFFPGWAVSGLGHCHPKVVKAVCKQAKKILHISNNFHNALQAKLAEKIIEHLPNHLEKRKNNLYTEIAKNIADERDIFVQDFFNILEKQLIE